MCILCLLYGQQLATEKQLPSSDTTFVYPTGVLDPARDVDWEAAEYLSSLWPGDSVVPCALAPLQTTGDGDCVIHAVSRAMWGVELFHGVLRGKLKDELSENSAWYRERLGEFQGSEGEWKDIVRIAGKEGSHLGFAHVFALANVLRRPIVVLASQSDIVRYGQGEGGVAATCLPLRHRPEDCATRMPITLAWSNSVKHHCVPLIAVEGAPRIPLPVVAVAYAGTSGHTSEELLSLYVDFSAQVKEPPVVRSLRGEKRQPGTGAGGISAAAIAAAAAAATASSPSGLRSSGDGDDGTLELIQTLSALITKKHQAKMDRAYLERKHREYAFKRASPEDGVVYDVVLPIQLGTSVSCVCCNIGDDTEAVARKFVAEHGIAESWGSQITAGLDECVRTACSGIRIGGIDVKPFFSLHSENATAVLMSVDPGHTFGIPCTFPVRYAKEPTAEVVSSLIQQLRKIGVEGSGILKFVADLKAFIAGEVDAQNQTVGMEGITELLRATIIRPVPYEREWDRQTSHPSFSCHSPTPFPPKVLDLFRYAVFSQPLGCSLIGNWESINKTAALLPLDTTPFACHIAFARLLANTMSNESALGEYKRPLNLWRYLVEVSRSQSRELRIPLAVFLLNTSIMSKFAELNEFCVTMMVRMLQSEREPANARTLLLALGTMAFNDERARIQAVKEGVLHVLEEKQSSMETLSDLISLVSKMHSM